MCSSHPAHLLNFWAGCGEALVSYQLSGALPGEKRCHCHPHEGRGSHRCSFTASLIGDKSSKTCRGRLRGWLFPHGEPRPLVRVILRVVIMVPHSSFSFRFIEGKKGKKRQILHAAPAKLFFPADHGLFLFLFGR